MNPKMSKRAFANSFKAKSKAKSKAEKWSIERGRKVTWKRQRAQDARSKLLERIQEEGVPQRVPYRKPEERKPEERKPERMPKERVPETKA